MVALRFCYKSPSSIPFPKPVCDILKLLNRYQMTEEAQEGVSACIYVFVIKLLCTLYQNKVGGPATLSTNHTFEII